MESEVSSLQLQHSYGYSLVDVNHLCVGQSTLGPVTHLLPLPYSAGSLLARSRTLQFRR